MDFFAQLNRFIKTLTGSQVMLIFIVFISVVGTLTFLSFYLKHDSFTLLYSKLSPEDAARIVEQLKNDNIPYRLSNSGQTIKVPSKKVFDLRLKLSMSGLPRGAGSGLELFDNSKIGMTDFMQQVNYQRAIQGELSRTISELAAVQAAKVHLSFSDESAFFEEAKEASASVVLTLQAGAVLDKRQIQGIVHLVASAVRGMNADKVTIVDSYGNLLSGGRNSSHPFSGGDEYFNLQRDVEEYLENKAVSMLEKVLGPERAVIRVKAELNTQNVHEHSETYDPTGVVRSEQVSNQATPTTLKNYELGKTVREVVGSAGTIEKLYISLVVDGVEKENPENPDEKNIVPRSQEELKNLSELVKRAVGFNEDREDQFDVKSIPFNKQHRESLNEKLKEQEAILKEQRSKEQIFSIIQRSIIAVTMIVIVIVFINAMKKNISTVNHMAMQSAPALAAGHQATSSAPGAAQLAGPQSAGVPAPMAAESRAEEQPAMPEVSPKQVEADFMKVAKDKPEEVAKFIQKTLKS